MYNIYPSYSSIMHCIQKEPLKCFTVILSLYRGCLHLKRSESESGLADVDNSTLHLFNQLGVIVKTSIK